MNLENKENSSFLDLAKKLVCCFHHLICIASSIKTITSIRFRIRMQNRGNSTSSENSGIALSESSSYAE